MMNCTRRHPSWVEDALTPGLEVEECERGGAFIQHWDLLGERLSSGTGDFLLLCPAAGSHLLFYFAKVQLQISGLPIQRCDVCKSLGGQDFISFSSQLILHDFTAITFAFHFLCLFADKDGFSPCLLC